MGTGPVRSKKTNDSFDDLGAYSLTYLSISSLNIASSVNTWLTLSFHLTIALTSSSTLNRPEDSSSGLGKIPRCLFIALECEQFVKRFERFTIFKSEIFERFLEDQMRYG